MNLSLVALFSLILLISCSENQKEIQPDLSLDGIQIELDIDFSKAKFNLDYGLDILATELTEYIFTEYEELDSRITDFQLRGTSDNIYINYSEKELIDIFSKTSRTTLDTFFADSLCEAQKKTCWSRSGVEKTLKQILGDGTRDVNIKYKRNTLSVTITWTYQDC